ncbi:MAG: hypothetical protein KDA60_21170, partial [Planctomycetales bacterium]|nr:hypothetical protein [Planctomycetales bacterium]
MRYTRILAAALIVLAGNPVIQAQDVRASEPAMGGATGSLLGRGLESPQRRNTNRSTPGVYKDRLQPHWLENGTQFWYRNDLRGNRREFIRVDAKSGKRERAFDHARLAAALTAIVANPEVIVQPDQLPFDEISWAEDDKTIRFRALDGQWQCDLDSYVCTAFTGDDRTESTERRNPAGRRRWNRGDGREAISPDGEWVAVVQDGNVFLRRHHIDEPATNEGEANATPEPPSDASSSEKESSSPIPDSTPNPAAAEDLAATQTTIPLTTDGSIEVGYGLLEWAPD